MKLNDQFWDAFVTGVIVIDKKGEIVIFNKAAEKIIGCSRDKAIGKFILDVIPNSSLLNVLKSGKPETNQRLGINGTTIVSDRSPIFEGSEIVGAISVFRDISDLEKLSKQLSYVKEINRELDTIIESMDDGIILVDKNGYVVRVNEAYKRLTGIRDEDYLGKHVNTLIEEGYIQKAISPLVMERRSKVTIIDVRCGRELLLTGVPVFDDNNQITCVVNVARDITELNKLKAKLAESEQTQNRYFRELELLRSRQNFKNIITRNPEMNHKLELAFHVAQVDSSVLILGETGVGKELLAQLIHRASKRAGNPFIKINCGAIPENLLETELFGYEYGAFTGALKEGKPGLFELAQKGTLFLDEIGELSLNLQVKILRAIQEKEITRIGGKSTIMLDVRIIAATNRDLMEMVKQKRFREDLFYRLNVVPIEIPPLRKRKEDIIPLANEFLNKINSKYGFQKWLHPDLINEFLNCDWPGNIRELENTIERLVVTSIDDCIGVDSFKLNSSDKLNNINYKSSLTKKASLKAILEEKEKQIICDTYKETRSTRKAAEVLGISQSSVVKKMKKYNISVT